MVDVRVDVAVERPARIAHVERLPLLPSGKPDRVALAALVAGRDAPPAARR